MCYTFFGHVPFGSCWLKTSILAEILASSACIFLTEQNLIVANGLNRRVSVRSTRFSAYWPDLVFLWCFRGLKPGKSRVFGVNLGEGISDWGPKHAFRCVSPRSINWICLRACALLFGWEIVKKPFLRVPRFCFKYVTPGRINRAHVVDN